MISDISNILIAEFEEACGKGRSISIKEKKLKLQVDWYILGQ